MFAFATACEYIDDTIEASLPYAGENGLDMYSLINDAANLFSSDYKSYCYLSQALREAYRLYKPGKVGGITRA